MSSFEWEFGPICDENLGNLANYKYFILKIQRALDLCNVSGDEAIIELLLENGADIDACNIENNTALITSIISGIHLNFSPCFHEML